MKKDKAINIYFAGSIRGGRQLAERYKEIIKYLGSIGHVYTEHVGDDQSINIDLNTLSDKDIHDRDMKWIIQSDVMVAEVSVPSLGVGYEIASAISMNKPVLCLYNKNAEHGLSAMIAGSKEVSLIRYESFDQLKMAITQFLKDHSAN